MASNAQIDHLRSLTRSQALEIEHLRREIEGLRATVASLNFRHENQRIRTNELQLENFSLFQAIFSNEAPDSPSWRQATYNAWQIMDDIRQLTRRILHLNNNARNAKERIKRLCEKALRINVETVRL